MKKNIIAIFLIILFIIPMCSCSARAEKREKITFRGIPFGTSYTETISALKEQGIEFNSEPHFDKEGAYYYNYYKGISAAGYEWTLFIQFMYTEKRMEMNPKVEDCVFTYAQYYEYSVSGQAIDSFKELELKLKNLYGDPVKESTLTQFSKLETETSTRWEKGDVNITLRASYSEYFNSTGFYIKYSWNTGEMAEKQNKMWYQEEVEKRKMEQALQTGTDGL